MRVNSNDPTRRQTALLVSYLMCTPNIYIFGGMLKHIVCPVTHPNFTDIDLIAIDVAELDRIQDAFAYVFRELPRIGTGPRYFIGKSQQSAKPIQLVLMRCHRHAMQFVIEGPQYDIDRAAYCNGRFYFDPAIGEEAIRAAITAKRATRKQGHRNMTHFAPHRQQIEQRHRLKLMRKGFAIID